MVELKPCPFCGTTPISRVSFSFMDPHEIAYLEFKIRCHNCGCERRALLKLLDIEFARVDEVEEQVIEQWNRRFDNASVD